MTPRRFMLDRRVPLALLFTLFLQAGTAVWWASASAAQDHFRDRRLQQLEINLSSESGRQVEILERLSRLEAQGDAVVAALRRIETLLGRR
ncbi:MAG TPA: hypothetical protein VHB73_07070 [Alphaproteobacteria bacterium]|nr:hypothetical protein [Alphaproteobacteria bacterium]